MKINEEDNKTYRVRTVYQLCNDNIESLCRKKRSGGLNTFCVGVNCTVSHRSSSLPLVDIDSSDILVMKNDTVAFLDTKGSSKSVDPEVLSK